MYKILWNKSAADSGNNKQEEENEQEGEEEKEEEKEAEWSMGFNYLWTKL